MKIKKAASLAVAASLAAVTAFAFTGCEWFSFKKKNATNTYEVATELGYTQSTGAWLASSGEEAHSEAYLMYQEARASGYSGSFMEFLQEINYSDGTAVVANVLKSVVTVSAGNGGEVSAGSGVIYAANSGGYYIATNYHVICNSTTHALYPAFSVTPYGESGSVAASYVGGKVDSDIAVLYAEFSSSVVRPIGSRGSNPVVGENIYAVGNTLGEGISVLSGIVSVEAEEIEMARADGRSGSVTMTVTRIDASVNHGNSGGGLFDKNGKLIGLVNGGKDMSVNGGKDTVAVAGFGYAIPYSTVSSVVQNIIAQYEAASVAELEPQAYCNGALVARLGDLETVASTASVGEDGLVYITESVRLNSVDDQSPFSDAAAGSFITEVEVQNQSGVKLYSKVIRRKHELEAVLMNVRKNNRVILTASDGSQIGADYTENAHFKLCK